MQANGIGPAGAIWFLKHGRSFVDGHRLNETKLHHVPPGYVNLCVKCRHVRFDQTRNFTDFWAQFVPSPLYVYIYICMTCVIAKDSNSRRNIHEIWRLKSLHFSLFKIVKSNSLSFLFYVSLFVRQTMRARWNANWKNLPSLPSLKISISINPLCRSRGFQLSMILLSRRRII